MKKLCAVFLCGILWIGGGAAVRAGVPVPILMYHDFVDDTSPCGPYAVTETRFREHLDALRQAGYETVSLQELLRYADGCGKLPEKPVILLADDGYTGVLTIAAPAAAANGMRLSCAVIGSFCGRDGHFALEEVPETVEIVSHTFDGHGETARGQGVCGLTPEQLREDIRQMQTFCGDAWPLTKTVFVYPFGAYTPETEQILRDSGCRMTLTCDKGAAMVEKGGDLFALPRMGVYQSMRGEDVVRTVEKVVRDAN